jgi:hypothetical protein
MIWMDELRRGLVMDTAIEASGARVLRLATVSTEPDLAVRVEEHSDPDGMVSDRVTGLEEAVYQQLVGSTVRAQRLAAYRYAARSLLRYRAGVLAQFAAATIGNKLRSALG